jgi:hypothetical protein
MGYRKDVVVVISKRLIKVDQICYLIRYYYTVVSDTPFAVCQGCLFSPWPLLWTKKNSNLYDTYFKDVIYVLRQEMMFKCCLSMYYNTTPSFSQMVYLKCGLQTQPFYFKLKYWPSQHDPCIVPSLTKLRPC